MSDLVRIVDVNDADGNVIATGWLLAAEAVHRQLRPQLPVEYVRKMQRVFAGGGRMCLAVRGDAAVGVAVYRIHENTVDDIQMYVDDLVTDDARRSRGVGKALMSHLQQLARAAGCGKLTLDSGTQRQQAHKFYFREGLVVTAFHFVKPLEAARD
jgi:GNAT superfamily N-acetyltransferase